MREILFRGKTFITKKMVTGTGILYDGTNTWIVNNEPPKALAFGMEHYTVIPETIGQYTGLTDKNGTQIFEGDIVNFKTTAYHFKNCRIKYQSCYARYCAIDNKGYEYPMDKTFEYEVIGNIHDNPELLKELGK